MINSHEILSETWHQLAQATKEHTHDFRKFVLATASVEGEWSMQRLVP